MRIISKLIVLSTIGLLLMSCTAASVTLPREVVDIAAKIERTLASEQVQDLSENLDDYLMAYTANFTVQPRRGDKPLEIAEAYMRENQPGPLPRVFQSTLIYDRKGVLLAEVFEEGQRTWVSLDKVSPHLIDAVIATEDASFYANTGVDPRRIVGAFLQNAEAGGVVSGASTITMQIARLLFFTPEARFEQSMERKIYEAMLAQELSTVYTKDELLEIYVNMVHFGRRAYGIEAASQVFFGKRAADLTLAEATLLAGTPQMPGGYDMLDDIQPVKERQKVVLSLMVRHGFLSQEEADAVFLEEPEINFAALQPQIKAPHFVNYVKQEMNKRLLGEDINRAGLRVYTTLDMRLQEIGEEVIAEQVEILKPRYDLSNAALVALRPGTSEILAMVGSADFADPAIDGQVNVAISPRQPGSAIKPILYATAIEDKLISPATVIWDVAVEYKLSNTEQYRPVNYDKEFHGPVTVRTALASSYNIPAVKLLDTVSVGRMLEVARAMGIQSLSPDASYYGLSLTLGGGEVTLLNLADAFQTIANGGRHIRSQAIIHVTGDLPEGYVHASNLPGEQVLSESTAWLITDMLSDNAARAPEFGENSPLRLSRPAAAKTGTTNDFRDNWTMGFTKYLVTGVWAGNSDGTPMVGASGVTGAAPIWNAFMETILADPELMDSLGMPQDDAAWLWERPASVIQKTLNCPQGLRCNGSEYFAEEWLTLLEDRDPQWESASSGNMSTVYADLGSGQQAVGSCSDAQGEPHTLLRAPMGIGASLPWHSESNTARLNGDTEYAKRIRAELMEAMSWSGRNSQPLYIGTCAVAESAVRQMYGDRVLAVSVGAYTNAIAQSVEDREQRATEGEGPTIDNPQPMGNLTAVSAAGAGQASAAQGSSSYNLLGVAHDGNCGGDFVIGTVANAQGQAVAGVSAVYRDQSGNVQTTASSGQLPGYGSFRFAIGNDSPQSISITLIGPGGQAISPTASVPHKQGGATDAG